MNKELTEKLLKAFDISHSLEDCEAVQIDGVEYCCYLVEELQIEDKGKYQNGGAVFSVKVYNGTYNDAQIDEPLLYIEQDFTRYGSYYSDYEYEYYEPYVVEKREITTTVWKSV